MASILGIDAAWTATEPSGVTLIRTNPDDGRWECVALAPSYNSFIETARGNPVQWLERPSAGQPDVRRLLKAAERHLGGERVSVISVDVPLSKVRITGRRKADNDISKKFGANGCGTHSPNDTRPGVISETLLNELVALGYNLAVNYSNASDPGNSVIEVYPHPALLRLLNRDFRVPYKTGGTLRYWPELTAMGNRKDRLIEEFECIHAGLSNVIHEIPDFLPKSLYVGTFAFLKRYEDALDALVCAWVGARYLENCAKPYGDKNAAIWVPS